MARPPVVAPYMLFLFFMLMFLFFMLLVSAAGRAFESLGVPPQFVMMILLGSLVGSMVNIPVMKVTSEVERVTYKPGLFGMLYPVPSIERVVQDTRVAVNLGGAIVPMLMCGYLVAMLPGAIVAFATSTIMVTIICRSLARPIPGLGISIPVLIPPLAAAASAFVVTSVLSLSIATAAAVAYVSGVLGVLIGADLLNLGRIRELGAPMVSIGGAGTFDGIFITGILSVILFPAA
jgi:uncharacterized membrane protein